MQVIMQIILWLIVWNDIGLFPHIPNSKWIFHDVLWKLRFWCRIDNVKCKLPASVTATLYVNIRTYVVVFISVSFGNLYSSLSMAFPIWKHICVLVFSSPSLWTALVSLFSWRSACYCIWLVCFDISTRIIWLWLKHLIWIWDFCWMITMLEGIC